VIRKDRPETGSGHVQPDAMLKTIDSRPKVPRLYADGRPRWPAINEREGEMYSRSGGVGVIGVIVIVVVILFLVGVIKL
jgi:hypothetical protein